MEDERGLPLVVFQIRLFTAGPIRFRRGRVVFRSGILEEGEHTSFVDANGVTNPVLAETLGSRYVFLPTYRFRCDPESPVVQPVSNAGKVVGDLEVVRPSTDDRRSAG
jgi:hypothetical protein